MMESGVTENGTSDSSTSGENVEIMKEQSTQKLQVDFAGTGLYNIKNKSRRITDFNMMLIGEPGIGKTSFVQTLLHCKLPDQVSEHGTTNDDEFGPLDLEIVKTSVILSNKNEKINLSIINVLHFGSSLDTSNCSSPILNYIEKQLNEYLKDESGINRKNIVDNRVHALVYLIAPFGHGLKELEIDVLKKVHERVNVFLVIAKGDTLTQSELEVRRKEINEDLEKNQIKCFDFANLDDADDEKMREYLRDLSSKKTLSVISADVAELADWSKPIRSYPWGAVSAEDVTKSDFLHLKNVLFDSYLEDLKLYTHDTIYENYRASELSKSIGR